MRGFLSMDYWKIYGPITFPFPFPLWFWAYFSQTHPDFFLSLCHSKQKSRVTAAGPKATNGHLQRIIYSPSFPNRCRDKKHSDAMTIYTYQNGNHQTLKVWRTLSSLLVFFGSPVQRRKTHAEKPSRLLSTAHRAQREQNVLRHVCKKH